MMVLEVVILGGVTAKKADPDATKLLSAIVHETTNFMIVMLLYWKFIYIYICYNDGLNSE